MSIYRIGKEFNEQKFIGLSTDTKPINCGAGSKFLESNTKDVYLFNGEEWIFYNNATDIDGGAF